MNLYAASLGSASSSSRPPPRTAPVRFACLFRSCHGCFTIRSVEYTAFFHPCFCFHSNNQHHSGLGRILSARAGQVRDHPQQGGRLPAQAPLGQGQQSACVVIAVPGIHPSHYTTSLKHRPNSLHPRNTRQRPTQDWTPDIARYTKSVMGDQLSRVREAVLKMDPQGVFRTQYLSEVFDLPNQ